jgi:hypothetical protein
MAAFFLAFSALLAAFFGCDLLISPFSFIYISE